MSEMSDRLCTVLATRLNAAFNGGPNVTVRELTVAVLEEMRIPAEDMILAGADVVDEKRHEPISAIKVSPATWSAMIDAALVGAATPDPPKVCEFECRAPDGSKPEGFGNGRAWCVLHGFDCPELATR